MSAFTDIANSRHLVREERGITGLETAIVLIAFVVVSSVFAFAALSTGLFSSDKAKEAIQAGLNEAQGTLEIRGVKGTATLTATTSQSIEKVMARPPPSRWLTRR